MKILWFVFFFFIVVFARCKKEKTEAEEGYFGYFKGEVNGVKQNFKANGGLLYNLSDSLSLNFENWEGSILRESISIQKIYKEPNITQRIYNMIIQIIG